MRRITSLSLSLKQQCPKVFFCMRHTCFSQYDYVCASYFLHNLCMLIFWIHHRLLCIHCCMDELTPLNNLTCTHDFLWMIITLNFCILVQSNSIWWFTPYVIRTPFSTASKSQLALLTMHSVNIVTISFSSALNDSINYEVWLDQHNDNYLCKWHILELLLSKFWFLIICAEKTIDSRLPSLKLQCLNFCS